MTTESSVLEKLKRYNELQAKLDLSGKDELLELVELSKWYRLYLPFRLIAALELVGQKAKEQKMAIGYLSEDNDMGLHDGMVAFAREVLAVLNNKDNKEQEGDE